MFYINLRTQRLLSHGGLTRNGLTEDSCRETYMSWPWLWVKEKRGLHWALNDDKLNLPFGPHSHYGTVSGLTTYETGKSKHRYSCENCLFHSGFKTLKQN